MSGTQGDENFHISVCEWVAGLCLFSHVYMVTGVKRWQFLVLIGIHWCYLFLIVIFGIIWCI